MEKETFRLGLETGPLQAGEKNRISGKLIQKKQTQKR
jgi:hypothetical protein